MVRLILEKLVKRYDRVAVVDEASLDVKPGELTTVLGPSGSGKTTMARLVVGLEPPDAGEIYLDDRLVHDLPPWERSVGLMTQDDALWPHLSVAENVGHGLRARGVARRERRHRVTEALATVGIESLADRRPDALSPLQRRRTELARELVLEPSLLVLDEPTGPLDPEVRPELRDLIRRVHLESGRTTLLLTRHRDEAMAVADRLAILDLGRIVQVGAPSEVYEAPTDAFVARLMGPANLLQGQIAGSDARGEIVVRTTIGRLIGRMVPPGSAEAMIGTPVTIAIRPESIRLGPTLPPDANRFTVTVERQSILGELRSIDLRGPGDWPLSATALHAQTIALREGQGLTVAVPPEQVIVLLGRYATGRTG